MPTTPIRQKLLKFVSPDIADFVVVQTVDVTRIPFPEKGTPHPDSVTYPNHKFTQAQAADEQGVLYNFYYVAAREAQDEYNWELSDVSIGGASFDAVLRTYITPRDGFVSGGPDAGTAMPDVPPVTFDDGYVLWSADHKRTEDEVIDALFIIESHTYIKPYTARGVQEGESGAAYATTIDLYYRGQVPPGETLAIEALIADPTNRWWGLQEDGTARNGKQLSDDWFVVQTGPAKDIRVKYSAVADAMGPDKFYCPKGETTTVVIEILDTLDAPAAITATPGTRVEVNQVGYIRTTATTTQEGTLGSLVGTDFDERTGNSLLEESTLVDVGDVVVDTVDANGEIDLYTPYDACHSIKRTVKVVDGSSKSWTEIINYEWPAVLKSLTLETWNRRDGQFDTFPNVKFKQAFNGPQLVHVTQHWQAAAPVLADPPKMIPEGFTFASPLYTLRVPPCLHGAIQLTAITGTSDPVYEYNTKVEDFAATNYTDWPASISWTDVKPWRGGYLVTAYTINKPDV